MGVALGGNRPAHYKWNEDFLRKVQNNQILRKADTQALLITVGAVALSGALVLGRRGIIGRLLTGCAAALAVAGLIEKLRASEL